MGEFVEQHFSLTEREVYAHVYAVQHILQHLSHAAEHDDRDMERWRSRFGLTHTKKQLKLGGEEYDELRTA